MKRRAASAAAHVLCWLRMRSGPTARRCGSRGFSRRPAVTHLTSSAANQGCVWGDEARGVDELAHRLQGLLCGSIRSNAVGHLYLLNGLRISSSTRDTADRPKPDDTDRVAAYVASEVEKLVRATGGEQPAYADKITSFGHLDLETRPFVEIAAQAMATLPHFSSENIEGPGKSKKQAEKVVAAAIIALCMQHVEDPVSDIGLSLQSTETFVLVK
jgi:hypothetical protein